MKLFFITFDFLIFVLYLLLKDQRNYFTNEKVANFMYQLLKAVDVLHANNFFHRDIKPENIMINQNDQVKIIDFGLAVTNEKNIKMRRLAGTPYYMAPEVLKGSYNDKADMWSLGVLLYTLVSGYLPFQG